MKTIKLHPASQRGSYKNSWLKSNFSFSFADYYDADHMHQGFLRVLNDDIIAPKSGFGTHPHKNMEIISIVLKGELLHKDSMGTKGTITPGEVQMMSAGTGVLHSEENPSDTEDVHLLQLWVLPNQIQTKPSYDSSFYEDSDLDLKWHLIAGPEKQEKSMQIKQEAKLYLSKIKKGQSLEKNLDYQKSMDYLFVIEGKLKFDGNLLSKRDAAYISTDESLKLEALEDSFILYSSSQA